MSSVTFVDELRQSVARMASGKLFQRRGAALENAFSPCVCTLHRGTSSRWASAERRSYGSAGNELVGRLSMMQLGRECFESSTLAVCTRCAVSSEASEDRLEQQ